MMRTVTEAGRLAAVAYIDASRHAHATGNVLPFARKGGQDAGEPPTHLTPAHASAAAHVDHDDAENEESDVTPGASAHPAAKAFRPYLVHGHADDSPSNSRGRPHLARATPERGAGAFQQGQPVPLTSSRPQLSTVSGTGPLASSIRDHPGTARPQHISAAEAASASSALPGTPDPTHRDSTARTAPTGHAQGRTDGFRPSPPRRLLSLPGTIGGSA